MTKKERKLALHCLKANSDYHSEVCEECINYPNCDHTIQDDVTETIIKALEQADVLNQIKEEIRDNTYFINEITEKEGIDFETVEKIIDKYTAESEGMIC